MKPLATALTLVVLFAAAAASPAQAQSDATAYEADVFWQLAAKQVVESLDSDLDHIRSQTLKNVIVFSTLYRDRIDLTGTVGAIADVAKSDLINENRRLARAALQAIGSFRAKHHLAELDGIDDDEYRLLVATVISEYYTKPNAL